MTEEKSKAIEPVSYKVFLAYKNEKTLNLFIPPEDVDIFLNCLNSSKMYTNKNTKVSFWTSKDSLEYIAIYPMSQGDLDAMNKVDENVKTEADK